MNETEFNLFRGIQQQQQQKIAHTRGERENTKAVLVINVTAFNEYTF